jgi:hypothetical protein
MKIENGIREVEKRRLEAERHKLELETKAIEGRLNARWWQASTFVQYAVAIVVRRQSTHLQL